MNMYLARMQDAPNASPMKRGEIEGFGRLNTAGASGLWGPGYARAQSDRRNILSTSNLTIAVNTLGANGRSATATAPALGVAYYVYAIVDADGNVAGLLDNAAVPTLPSGYIDYVMIDTCFCQSASLMGVEWGAPFGRQMIKQYVWAAYVVSVTDAQAALALTMIPSGAGGSRVTRATVALSTPTPVAGQAPYVRSTASGPYWFRAYANNTARCELALPVLEDNLYVDATEPGTTLAAQMGLMTLTIERGGSLA